MSGPGRPLRNWRSVFLTLAALALMVRIVVPPGYMVDSASASPHLVICTGHGPLDLGRHDKAPGHKSSDAPCAFAGAATPITPPLPALIAAPTAARIEAAASARLRDLMPGRGFAAPPPPSQAPPAV